MNRPTQVVVVLVVAFLAIVPLLGSRYLIDLSTEIIIYALFALSLNVLIGYAGLVSFGHAAYFAIGGYTCAILLTTYGWPLWLGFPAAMVASGLAALVIGFFCVRLTSIYFAMLAEHGFVGLAIFLIVGLLSLRMAGRVAISSSKPRWRTTGSAMKRLVEVMTSRR